VSLKVLIYRFVLEYSAASYLHANDAEDSAIVASANGVSVSQLLKLTTCCSLTKRWRATPARRHALATRTSALLTTTGGENTDATSSGPETVVTASTASAFTLLKSQKTNLIVCNITCNDFMLFLTRNGGPDGLHPSGLSN